MITLYARAEDELEPRKLSRFNDPERAFREKGRFRGAACVCAYPARNFIKRILRFYRLATAVNPTPERYSAKGETQ